MTRVGRIGLLVVALALAPAVVRATTAVALNNRVMAQTADVIAVGRCVEVRSANGACTTGRQPSA